MRIRRVPHFCAVLIIAVVSVSCGGDNDGSETVSIPVAEPAAESPSQTEASDAQRAGSDQLETAAVVDSVADIPAVAPQPEAPAADDQPSGTASDDGDLVSVYWGWTIETVSSSTPERLGAGGRAVTTRTTAEAAMRALLEGPNAVEAGIGMVSAIPAGTRLLGVNVSDDVATVDLSNEFNIGGGTLGEAVRFAQVVFTLTQFDEVDAVSFRIDGVDAAMLGTHGFDVTKPIDRDHFDFDVRPFILLEHPFPGEEFASGDRLIGESNTFEGTVEYVIVDAEGLIIGEGFTTATAGNGTWGRFDEAAAYDANVTGLGGVIVFETSPEDGSQTNVVEYPVMLTSGAPDGDAE